MIFRLRQIKEHISFFINLGYSKIVLLGNRKSVEEMIQKLFNISSDLEDPIHKLGVQLSSVLSTFRDCERITSGLHQIENVSIEESHITGPYSRISTGNQFP